MFVQVVAVTLLPSLLVFLLLLLNDEGHMGEHVNTRWQNVANGRSSSLRHRDVHRCWASQTLFPNLLPE